MNFVIPESVWWITSNSRVPSSQLLINSERIASSVTLPPALRITWASPISSPRNRAGSRRASMQVRTAKGRAGGTSSFPLSNPAAHAAFAWLIRSTSDMEPPPQPSSTGTPTSEPYSVQDPS